MKNKFLVFALSFSLMGATSVAAAEIISLSFQDAIRMASEKNVRVLLAHERVGEAIAQLGKASSALFPSAHFDISQSRQTKNLEALGIASSASDPVVGPFRVFDARFSAEQMFFDLESIERLRAARSGKKLSALEEKKAKQDAVALVGVFYLKAEQAGEAIHAAEALAKRDRQQFKIAQKRYELGLLPRVEVIKSKARFFESLDRLHAARNEARDRKFDLLTALNLPVDREVKFIKDPRFKTPEFSEEMLKEKNMDIQAAEELVRQKKREAAAAWASLFPKVKGIGNVGQSGKTPSDSESTYFIGVQASVPLFEGGRHIFQIKDARHQLKESRILLEDTAEQNQARISRAEDTIHRMRKFIRAKQIQLISFEKELLIAESREKMGLGSALDILEAEAEKALSETQKNEAVASYRAAQIELARALGHVETLAEGDWL